VVHRHLGVSQGFADAFGELQRLGLIGFDSQ
jgi:hypothetical protein